MKHLIIGDLHVMPSNLQDTSKIFDYAAEICVADNNVRSIVFTGDIFHTHDQLKQSIVLFVQEAMKTLHLKTNLPIYIVTGNHDLIGPSNDLTNANRIAFAGFDYVKVADSQNMPYQHEEDASIVMVPYIHDANKFVEVCNTVDPKKTVICHQTFDGARYEGGFYAKDGISLDKLNGKFYIGGHIHTQMTLGDKAVYVGSPRATTANEVNHQKFLVVYDSKSENFTNHPTNHLVKCYKLFELTEGLDLIKAQDSLIENEKDDVRVKISGSETYYKETIAANQHLIGKLKFIPDIKKNSISSIDVESTTSSMEELMKEFVYKTCDRELDAEGLWNKIQNLM